MTWEQSSLSQPWDAQCESSRNPSHGPETFPVPQGHLKGTYSPPETSHGSGQSLVPFQTVMNPQPSSPSSNLRPPLSAPDPPTQHQQPLQHIAGQKMRQWAAFRTSKDFTEASGQLHAGASQERKKPRHMVGKQQHRGGKSHPPGSRSPASVTPTPS